MREKELLEFLSMSKFKAIFFDSGDVLMKEGLIEGIKQYEEKYRLTAGRVFEAAHDRPYWREFTLGNISEADYLDKVSQDLGGNFQKLEFRQIILQNFTPNIELINFIKTLKFNYIFGVISNNPKEWFDFLFTKFGWNDLFQVKAVSGYLHVRKPDARIFQYALNEAAVAGSEAIYVDNRPERVKGGQISGMRILIMKDNDQIKHDLKLLLSE